MPLYPNTPFIEGQIVTPDLLYTAYNPVFDDQTQYLGHLPRLSDDSLSNAAGQLKDRINGVTNNFKVTAGSGLTANYTAGALINNNDLVTVVPGNVLLPANSNVYIYIDRTNTVKVATTLPVVRIMLAFATTNASSITSITDLRTGAGYPILMANQQATSVFGGQGEDGAYVAVNGDILDQGEYNFSSFTVNAGVAITVKAYAKIRVSGNVTINGTIIVSSATAGASIVAITQQWGTTFGGFAGTGIGAGGGEIPASTYNYQISPVGSGGGGGYNSLGGNTNRTLFTAAGGRGGGGLQIEASGIIIVGSTGTIQANGTAGGNSNRQFTNHGSGGGGGGSGGLISFKSITSVVVQGTLEVRGGAGGSGDTNGDVNQGGEAGSGGGGGVIALIAPNVNTTGSTIQLGGGAAGAIGSLASAFVGIGGTGGSFGGLGGTQTGNGVPGEQGITIVKRIIPSV